MWGVRWLNDSERKRKTLKKLADVIPTHEIQLPPMLHQVEGSAGVPYILIDFEIRI
jgi:hypothetical protein